MSKTSSTRHATPKPTAAASSKGLIQPGRSPGGPSKAPAASVHRAPNPRIAPAHGGKK